MMTTDEIRDLHATAKVIQEKKKKLRSENAHNRFDLADANIRPWKFGNLVKASEQIRNKKGSSLVEMTAVIAILVPFLAVAATSVTLLLTAATFSDNLCREAARCASVGPPNAVRKGAPESSAQEVVASMSQANPFITISPNVLVSEIVLEPIPHPPFGGPVDGSVTVITTVNVQLPLLSRLPHTFSWQSRSTVPYTWVMKPCTN
jgi:hypothetical protein